MTAGLTKSSSQWSNLCWHHGKRGKPQHQGVKDGMCTNGIQNVQEWGLMWIAMDCHSLCITSKQGIKQRSDWERGCSPVASLRCWTDEVSVPGTLQVSSSGGIISTWMNMDNWPLNCQRNRKHLFHFFIVSSDNWYINPKNVPKRCQSIKLPRFFADDNQPYLKIKKREKETIWIKELQNWVEVTEPISYPAEMKTSWPLWSKAALDKRLQVLCKWMTELQKPWLCQSHQCGFQVLVTGSEMQ